MNNVKSKSRLQSLYSIGILDTPPDERFDRITRIASRIFKVPISIVSLVDRERQWFKSSFGLDNKSTPIHDSFCSLTVESELPLFVENALKDLNTSIGQEIQEWDDYGSDACICFEDKTGKVIIAPAISMFAPNERATASLISTNPIEWFGFLTRIFKVICKKMLACFANKTRPDLNMIFFTILSS